MSRTAPARPRRRPTVAPPGPPGNVSHDAAPDDVLGEPTLRLSWWPVVWAIALGLVVTAVVSFATDFEPADMHAFVERLHPGWFALALATLALRVVFGGMRLAAVSSGRLTLAHGIRGQLAWDFFSNVTPSAIGGGPFVAAYVARDRGIPLGEGAAILLFAMLVEQFWTFLSTLFVLAMLLLGLPVMPESVGPWGKIALGGYAAVMAVWTVVMTTALLYRPTWIGRGVAWAAQAPLLRRRRARILTEGRHLEERAAVLRGHGLAFYLRGFVYASLAWITRYAMLVFLVWSVDPTADGPLVFLRYMALTLGTMILPTPGGAGGAEGFFALFIGPLVTPAALVTPLLIVWRLLGYYLFLVLGLPLALRRGDAPVPPSGDAATPSVSGDEAFPASASGVASGITSGV